MPHVLEFNRIEQLAPYRLVWRSLLLRTRGASLFHSLEWLETYWRHFGGGRHLRVLLVESCGHPIGILPLVVTPEATRLGTVRALTYPLAGWGSYYGPIGSQPALTLAAGLRHVQATPRDWSLLDLRCINRRRHDRGRAQRALKFAGLPAREGIWSRTALAELEGGWDDYWQSRPARFRQTLRRRERRALAAGSLRYERYRPLGTAHADDDPRWDLLETCTSLAGRSCRASSADGISLCSRSVQPFLHDVHRLAARLGMLDVNLLYVGNQPAAFAYNYASGGSVYGLQAGCDPRFRRLGVGGLLYRHSLEDSCRRGDHTYDFGSHSFQGKRPWMTRLAPIHHLVHYPSGDTRARLLRAKHWWDERVGTGSKKPQQT